MATAQQATIFWFSGTGNSLAVAKTLAKSLGEARLVPMMQAPDSAQVRTRIVGLVFPVYAFGLPNAVASFLQQVPVGPEPYVFTVATAAQIPGGPHRQAERVLAQRGIALAAGWTVLMPGNFAPLGVRLALHRQSTLLRRMEGRVQAIARAVRQGVRGRRQDSLAPLAWIGQMLHRGASRHMGTAARGFRVLGHCTACGGCARVCPVGNVLVGEDGPVWGDHCEWCFACLQWCPVGAIGTTGLAGNRVRYRHPDIRAAELAAQTLRADPPPAEPGG